MSEQLIENAIAEVMDNFGFDKVHEMMVRYDWKWDIGKGEMAVPSIYRLMKEADRLLHDVVKDYGNGEYRTLATGGFRASLCDDELVLEFILTESVSFVGDEQG